MTEPPPAGPLAGLKVLEMAGLGPVPLAGLMLAEFGADVVRIERRTGMVAPSSRSTSSGPTASPSSRRWPLPPTSFSKASGRG